MNTIEQAILTSISELLAEHHIAPRWLKLKAAAKYSGIGQKRLKTLALANRIKGYSDPDSGRKDWIFDKESLDRYRLKPMEQIQFKAQKTLDLIRKRA